jgi:flagellar hook-associated protein 3 FlgL
MAISPIQVTRVSQGMQTDFALGSLRQNQLALFQSQSRIATGRRFVAPSEDPVSAARAVDLGQTLSQQDRFRANLQYADTSLAAADAAISEISSLLIEALNIASQNVSNLTSADERAAEAELIADIRQQLQIVGNRQLLGRYIFGGRDTLNRPFIDALGAIAYVGDTGDRFTRIDGGLSTSVNVTGDVLFNALSSSIATDVDLTPRLTDAVRIEDLRGATGRGIRPGTLVFNEQGGAGTFTVDLTSVDTIGDVAEAINDAAAAAGSSLTASVSDTGLVITPGSVPVSIHDTNGGVVAADLGIRTPDPTANVIQGPALLPRVTRTTPVADLAGGAGIDLDGGLLITNGQRTATIDLSQAVTVQDILNTINGADVQVLARVNDAGTGIDLFNQVSGTSLSVGENGGTTAADLGVRTFDTATPLDQLNFGRGVTVVPGEDDLRITAKDGSTVDVNLDGAQTIGDVIDIINAAATAAGVAVRADFAPVGNGIRLTDQTGGPGDLSVSLLNLSAAAIDLGLQQTVTGAATELLGTDINPVRTDGILDALWALEQGLRADDTQAISTAGSRLEELRADVVRVHGIVGARSQAASLKKAQMDDAALTTERFLSEVQDLDYAEAVTRLQAAMTQMQANLQTSSLVLNLTLLDFLR